MKIFFMSIFWVMTISLAQAHQTSDSFLHINMRDDVSEHPIEIQWEVAIRDLQLTQNFDTNFDGAISWGELKRKQQSIINVFSENITISSVEGACSLQDNTLLLEKHSDGYYAVIKSNANCTGNISEFDINYNFLFDIDALHKSLVIFSAEGTQMETRVISSSERTLSFSNTPLSVIGQFSQFVKEGVWHIGIGYDHILFLICLLLPVVWIRKNRKLDPVTRFKPVLIDVVKLVTAFTLAHSITLALASLNIVTIPAYIIESLIAFSIIVAATNNLYPFIKKRLWWMAFAFGLIHGFGFANVLSDLGLNNEMFVINLIGFNVGVELGQLVIVAVVLPIIYWARNFKLYKGIVYPASSTAMVFIGGFWLIERVA
ncbi:MAG: HupE/UreJ family protein [Ectothiorhodospiraceae bacterium]|nr:HupE/UreJ family protein [Ectothiorhodospiraceae bacterium]